MSKNQLKGDVLLIITTMIWGTAFALQKKALVYVGPISLNVIRGVISGIALGIFLIISGNRKKKQPYYVEPADYEKKAERKLLLKAGLSCGVPFAFACILQNAGLQYTTAGKGGFITTLYVILVPLLRRFSGHKMRPVMWLGAVLSCCGLYLLCMPENETMNGINHGDFLIFLAAITFAFQILSIDKYAPLVDNIKLSWAQFTVGVVFGLGPMLYSEGLNLAGFWAARWSILYLGLFSSCLAYTFQVIAQRLTEPVIASILMSLESVFSVIAGALILHEVMSGRGYLGCILMFSAVIISQLPERKNKKNKAA